MATPAIQISLPVEQWGTKYDFATPTGAISFTHYINIVKKSNLGKVSLDGTNQTGFTNIAGTNYYVLNGVNVAAGVHNLTGDSIFVVSMYGDEAADGYCNQVSGSSLLPVIMPVVYASFSAALTNDKQVKLTWITGEERNAKEYIVERMTGNDAYTPVGSVTAVGNTTMPQTYTFVDDRPHEGYNYYRLKQIDYNGQTYYSNMVSMAVTILQTRILNSQWVDNNLELSFNTSAAGIFTFLLYDMQGRCITKEDISTNSEGNSSLRLNTAQLAPVMYLVAVANNNSILQQMNVVK